MPLDGVMFSLGSMNFLRPPSDCSKLPGPVSGLKTLSGSNYQVSKLHHDRNYHTSEMHSGSNYQTPLVTPRGSVDRAAHVGVCVCVCVPVYCAGPAK